MWDSIHFFKQEEFDSPDAPGSGSNMDLNFVLKLDKLREMFAAPLAVSSGYRTPTQNASVGGVIDSAHTRGLAADIACGVSTDRYRLLSLALLIGFNRIGIHKHFIHLDADTSLPQSVLWLY